MYNVHEHEYVFGWVFFFLFRSHITQHGIYVFVFRFAAVASAATVAVTSFPSNSSTRFMFCAYIMVCTANKAAITCVTEF